MIVLPFFAGLIAAVLVFNKPITCRFLQFFQQEEYDDPRYLRWLLRTGSFERRATLAAVLGAVVLGGLWSLPFRFDAASLVLCLLCYVLVLWAGRSNKPDSTKKALVFTARASRILYVCLFCQMAFALTAYSAWAAFVYRYIQPGHAAALGCGFFLTLIFLIVFTAFAISIANRMLAPYEHGVQRAFLNEAKDKLQQYEPRVIGITGSFGKTSVKHILLHVLSAHQPTLATPGSVNTPMGVTRIIREQLQPQHRYFLVEMGAYGIGSIQRLCDLTPPHAALVTAVGMAHYERFRALETVAEAKSELPRSVPASGMAIFNGDNPFVRGMAEKIKCPAYFYGTSPDHGPLHCRLLRCECGEQGTHIELEYEGERREIHLPLYGRHQAMNAAAAFLAAAKLEVPLLTIQAALNSVPAIAHRLVVQRTPEGITHIDDSYNSNPDGFRNALEVLQSLQGPRRLLVTPGMVELGDKHDEEHENIGAQAAQVCDWVALIAPQRIEALRRGLLNAGFSEERIKPFDSLQQAREWMAGFLQPGDVVLLENDLPDLYESQTAFRLF